MSPLPVPVDFAPPSVVAFDHNAKIEKVAREIQKRAAFLGGSLHENTYRREQIIDCAGASGMESGKFHVLWCYLKHGNKDGGSIFVSEKTVAEITGKSESTVRRLTKELEKEGWLPAVKKGRREAATRTATISKTIMQSIISEMVAQARAENRPVFIPDTKPSIEIQDRSKMSGLKLIQDHSETNGQDTQDQLKMNGQEPQGRSKMNGQEVKTAQNEHLRPLISSEQENLKKEPSISISIISRTRAHEDGCDNASAATEANLVEEDFKGYQRLFSNWGQKPGTVFFNKPRTDTDPCLLGALRALESTYPRKLAVGGVQAAIASMLAQTALTDPSEARGGRGFGSFFHKVCLARIGELKAAQQQPQQLPPPQAQQTAPPQKHWRDVERENSLAISRKAKEIFGKYPQKKDVSL